MHTVDQRGRVVIAKAWREALGVQPGWRTVQRLVGDRVEIPFLSPSPSSLKGRLAPFTDVVIPPGETWSRVRQTAWAGAADEWAARSANVG